MAAGWVYVNGTWTRITGSDLTLGTGHEQAARGDHDHQWVPIRLFYSGSWPTRPAGAYSVDWVGPTSAPTPPWTDMDTWTKY